MASAPRSAQDTLMQTITSMAAVGSLEVHGVERRDRLDLARGHPQHARDLGHRLGRDLPQLVLHRPEGGQDRAARVRIAIAGALDLRPRLRLQRHRSTSPRTMSMDPMTATTSAISSPRTMCGSALRLLNDGARTLQRYGRLVPSLTR